MLIRRPVFSCSSFCSSSTRSPLRPISMPGRAENSITLTSSRVRSISILEIDGYIALPNLSLRSLMKSRIFWSSISRSANSCFEAYQRLFQPIMMPVRKPMGLTF